MTAGRPAAVLSGLGSWQPPTVVGNDVVAARLGVSEEWILQRTGVRTRRRVEPGTATVEMAVEAGTRALKSDGAGQVDAVLLATGTPDRLCPSSAPTLAARLGLCGVAALDVSGACSGFLYGLAVAGGLLAAGTFHRVLLVGADTMSSVVDPEDRTTAAIFGDAAGAVVLRAGDPEEPGALGPFALGSDGDHGDLIHIAGGGALDRRSRISLAMDGRSVFRHALHRMGGAVADAAELAGWSLHEVDRFAVHQANARISRALAADLGVDPARWISNIEHAGNTTAASVPLLLDHANRHGALRPGQRVVLAAFGAGLTWGGTSVTWPTLAAGD
ncbi:beta-ketoacyl-ACP synthase 3 [Streptomyces mayteni]